MNPSGYWHIRIQCRDWEHLTKVIFPYFSQLYGEKYIGILKMKEIHELLKTSEKVRTAFVTTLIVTLAYSITSSGNRHIPMIEKIIKVNGSIVISKDTFTTMVNTTPICINWLLGFILGDGNIYMRIRDTIVGLEFSPIIRITQKNTTLNIELFRVIIDFLSIYSINAVVDQAQNIELRIFGKKNVTNFIELLPRSAYYYFWKKVEFNAINKILFLLNLNIRGWKNIYVLVLTIIYSLPNDRKHTFDHWIHRLDEIFDNRSEFNDYFITKTRKATKPVC